MFSIVATGLSDLPSCRRYLGCISKGLGQRDSFHCVSGFPSVLAVIFLTSEWLFRAPRSPTYPGVSVRSLTRSEVRGSLLGRSLADTKKLLLLACMVLAWTASANSLAR